MDVKIRPKKWWLWLTPSWWKYKKTVEHMVKTKFEEGWPVIEKAMSDMTIYGEGGFLLDKNANTAYLPKETRDYYEKYIKREGGK